MRQRKKMGFHTAVLFCCLRLVFASWENNSFSSGSSGTLFSAKTKVRHFNAALLSEQTSRRAPAVLVRGQCDKWAVITSIFPPTALVNQLANLSDWCTVVVGDRKSPTVYEANVDFLPASRQPDLNFSILPFLAWDHFGRKNVGYVYAILHGARWIYDTDDDNPLKSQSPLSRLGSLMTMDAELQCSHLICNPYPIFSPRSGGVPIMAWPRGLSLELIRASRTERTKSLSTRTAVVQSLADHDPDVDAVYRLTRPLPFYFSRSRRPVIIPSERYAPFNAQATVFAYDALWALLLPVTVHGRVSDIWRSYIVQRLFRDMGLRLGFSPPWVKQIRNSHNYLGDFQSEIDLYLKSGEFVQLLNSWNSSSMTLQARLQELYIYLYEHGLLDEKDVLLVHAWVSDLNMLGYPFPPVI